MTRVLLVEDDPAVATPWAETLRNGGFDVHVASSAREALDLDHPFDLLVCEAELPDASGGQLIHELRQRRPPMRVLLLAASMPDRPPPDVQILMKPFPAEALCEVLAELPPPSPEPATSPPGPRVTPLLAALALALVAVVIGWWALREEPLPAPRDSGVQRGTELRVIEPRGSVAPGEQARWTARPGAVRYVLWIRRLDGSVAWQASTARESVELRDAELLAGVPYLLEVEAFDPEGRRLGLSETVEFQFSSPGGDSS